ncbi:MAG: hypothetical protein KF681_00490 [Bdellovibrionaceae bacterium]|nr:hypothetical protein [Pseudobdellovibrionaceae bacterium]
MKFVFSLLLMVSAPAWSKNPILQQTEKKVSVCKLCDRVDQFERMADKSEELAGSEWGREVASYKYSADAKVRRLEYKKVLHLAGRLLSFDKSGEISVHLPDMKDRDAKLYGEILREMSPSQAKELDDMEKKMRKQYDGKTEL